MTTYQMRPLYLSREILLILTLFGGEGKLRGVVATRISGCSSCLRVAAGFVVARGELVLQRIHDGRHIAGVGVQERWCL